MELSAGYSTSTFCGLTKDGGIEKVKKVLEDVAVLFPQEWLIPYNPACYCSQLGQLDKAKVLLHASHELGDKNQIKLMTRIWSRCGVG